MPRTITEHEMQRRRLVAKATSAMMDVIADFSEPDQELTALEWLRVLEGVSQRMLGLALQDEWSEE